MWFANQLSDDACATQAILNVLLNSEDVRLGDAVQAFKENTAEFDSVVRGISCGGSQYDGDEAWR